MITNLRSNFWHRWRYGEQHNTRFVLQQNRHTSTGQEKRCRVPQHSEPTYCTYPFPEVVWCPALEQLHRRHHRRHRPLPEAVHGAKFVTTQQGGYVLVTSIVEPRLMGLQRQTGENKIRHKSFHQPTKQRNRHIIQHGEVMVTVWKIFAPRSF